MIVKVLDGSETMVTILTFANVLLKYVNVVFMELIDIHNTFRMF